MFKFALRGVVVALFAWIATVPAYADGQVEKAMQLWMADLKDAYDNTRELVRAGNTDDGAPASAKLQQLAEQMNQATSAILQNASSLSPELGTAWNDTQRAVDAFSQAARTVAAQVGAQAVDLDTLESRFETADDALHASWDFTKNFGKQFDAIATGPLANANALFSGAVTDSYNRTTQFIDNQNFAQAKEDMAKLRDLTGKLQELCIDIGNKATAFSRSLLDLWTPANSAFNQFQTEVGVLSSEIGKTTVSLSNIETYYANLNAALVRSTKDMTDFGTRLNAISDNRN